MTATYNEAGVTYNDASVLYNGIALGERATLIVNEVDVTQYLADRSLSVTVATHGNSLGTLDATLNDPAVLPVVQQPVDLYIGNDRRYRGTLKVVDVDEYRGGHVFASIGAQDSGPIGGLPSAAPFAISDAPIGSEKGYESLSMMTRTTEIGSAKTTAKLTLRENGLWANQNVNVTSANHNLAAQEFTIREATVSWPNRNAPKYTLTLGDPLVKLAQLVQEIEVPDGSITETKISDGAISTPKLHADAVIARVANIGSTVVIGPAGIDVTGGAASIKSTDGSTLIDSTSVNLSEGTGRLPSGVEFGDVHTVVTAAGIVVTDGVRDRVTLGAVGGGDFGAKIVGSTGSTIFDGSQITIAGSTGSIGDSQISAVSGSKLSGGTIPAGVALGIAQTTVTASGVKVATGGVDRVILGDIGGSDFGLKVVNAASTVIIDGTSQMFKIVVADELSVAGVDGSGGSGGRAENTSSYATGQNYTPAFVGFYEGADAVGPIARTLPSISWQRSNGFAGDGTINDILDMWVRDEPASSNVTAVVVWETRENLVGATATVSYFILREQAF